MQQAKILHTNLNQRKKPMNISLIMSALTKEEILILPMALAHRLAPHLLLPPQALALNPLQAQLLILSKELRCKQAREGPLSGTMPQESLMIGQLRKMSREFLSKTING